MTSETLNKVNLIGFCGEDPEMIFVKTGNPVCNFRIATHKNYKNSSGNFTEETTWHNLSAWNHVAEYVSKHVKKGTKVWIEGEIQMSSYPSKTGIRKDHYFVLVSELKIL